MEAGSGGAGLLSFRREKFIARGGPDGGDGGNGGSVILRGSRNLNGLSAFRHRQILHAENGQAGGNRRKHGASGQDLIVEVPVGTQIWREGRMIADLAADQKQHTVAKGGRGGFGNAHFTSSVRRAPQFAEKGEPGEEATLTLELKLLADVGLVGLPNCGKSTLLSVISNAKPAIADYPFTTLTPNLGVADVGSRTILVADIPGLIAGASQGKGLGDDFLRHIERTAVLIHLVDSYHEDVARAYQTIRNELQSYKVDLTKKPEIIALSRSDGLGEALLERQLTRLRKAAKRQDIQIISSHSKRGLAELLQKVADTVVKERRKEATKRKKGKVIIELKPAAEDWWLEKAPKSGWIVHGEKLEGFSRRTDYSNDFAVERLKDILRRRGVNAELLRRGAKEGDRIMISGGEDFITF